MKIRSINAWRLKDLQEIEYGLYLINGQHGFDGNTNAFGNAFGNVTFVSVAADYFSDDVVGDADWQTGVIHLEPDASKDTVIHEMGHILSGSLKRQNDRVPSYAAMYTDVFDRGLGATDYGRKNRAEDFADSFLAVIKYGPYQNPAISDSRVLAIMSIMASYTSLDHYSSPGR